MSILLSGLSLGLVFAVVLAIIGIATIRTRIQCQHLHATGVYGDGASLTGKRGHCTECGAWLDTLPYSDAVRTESHRLELPR